jgi:putative transposase
MKTGFPWSFPGRESRRIMAFAESFIGSFRDECLNVNWFLSFEDACDKIEA